MPHCAEKYIGSARVEIVKGDITVQDTTAIVNAANRQLAPGGGVSGAIHRAAGPGLWKECRELGSCATGEAKITGGYQLKARYVLHTVGPVYKDAPGDATLLEDCFRNCLRLALEKGIRSISFPAISTGIFGYPVEAVAAVSLEAVQDFLKENPGFDLVRFVLFSEDDFRVFKEAMHRVLR